MSDEWIAPPYADARNAYYDGNPLPIGTGDQRVRVLRGTGPMVTFSGWWIYILPPHLWSSTPKQVRVALTALYKDGYRSIEEIAGARNADLLDVDNVSEQRLGQLRQWLHSAPFAVTP